MIQTWNMLIRIAAQAARALTARAPKIALAFLNCKDRKETRCDCHGGKDSHVDEKGDD